MKYYLPTHCDIGNRGCEAITLATSKILGVSKQNYKILSKDINLDSTFNVDKYASIYPIGEMSKLSWQLFKLHSLFYKDLYEKQSFIYEHQYGGFIKEMNSEDLMLSTGGDMFCYDDNEAVFTSEFCQKRGLRTILWACSIGEKNLSSRKIDVLRKYEFVYARESLTKKVLEKCGVTNVYQYPDPAFILQPSPFVLPSCFSDIGVVGINLSNFVLGGFTFDSSFGKDVISLVNYILDNTTFNVVLFPHVLWASQDDRIVANLLKNKFSNNNRVSVLRTDKLNYCQIRYAISKCRFFIGARTHSVISAYSMCVPTIALGYSIKSKGIAKDLGLDDYLVVNSSSYDKETLNNSFKLMLSKENDIRNVLEHNIPNYVESVYEVKNSINNYL